MLKNILSITIIILGIITTSAHANVAITKVTNQYSATNGCIVNSVAGGSNYIIWTVNCPSENGKIVSVKLSSENGSCTVTAMTTGYITSSNCASYTVYRQQSSASTSSVPATNCVTQHINIGQTCYNSGCSESFGRACSAAGGRVYVDFGGYSCKKTVCQ